MFRKRRSWRGWPDLAQRQIGHPKNRGTRGGRPGGYDIEDYKARNVVERFFNRMKHWRGLAGRNDKHASVYRCGVDDSKLGMRR